MGKQNVKIDKAELMKNYQIVLSILENSFNKNKQVLSLVKRLNAEKKKPLLPYPALLSSLLYVSKHYDDAVGQAAATRMIKLIQRSNRASVAERISGEKAKR